MSLLTLVDISKEFNSPFGASGGKTIGDLVSLFLKGSLVVAGIFVLVLFLVAGFSIIAGAGGSNPEAAEKGKKAMTGALTGFVVVFAAYWIIRIIEVLTGTPFITQPGV